MNNKRITLLIISILLFIILAQRIYYYSGQNGGQYVSYKFLSQLVDKKRAEFEKNGSKEPDFTADLSKVLEADTCRDLQEYLMYNTGMNFSYLLSQMDTKNKEQRKYIMKFIEYLVLEKKFLNNERPDISTIAMIRPPMTSDTLNYGDELLREFCVVMKNTNKSFRVSFPGKEDTLIEGNDLFYTYRTKCTQRGNNILEGAMYYYMYGQEVSNSFRYEYYVK